MLRLVVTSSSVSCLGRWLESRPGLQDTLQGYSRCNQSEDKPHPCHALSPVKNDTIKASGKGVIAKRPALTTCRYGRISTKWAVLVVTFPLSVRLVTFCHQLHVGGNG